ncbi:hypothetical protein A2U01_0075340, partial [Trifolium medium]|nr:hypothetical protein [Trifolium medium]
MNISNDPGLLRSGYEMVGFCHGGETANEPRDVEVVRGGRLRK